MGPAIRPLTLYFFLSRARRPVRWTALEGRLEPNLPRHFISRPPPPVWLNTLRSWRDAAWATWMRGITGKGMGTVATMTEDMMLGPIPLGPLGLSMSDVRYDATYTARATSPATVSFSSPSPYAPAVAAAAALASRHADHHAVGSRAGDTGFTAAGEGPDDAHALAEGGVGSPGGLLREDADSDMGLDAMDAQVATVSGTPRHAMTRSGMARRITQGRPLRHLLSPRPP